jgi:two-component system OmpR family response regulator
VKRILVVDDEPGMLEVLTEILRLDGYQVDTAADGAEALLLIGQTRYDAVLSDVSMPRLDGFGLYGKLQQWAPSLCRRIGFMAGRFDAVDQLTTANLPVLAKPATVEEIRGLVKGLLEAPP